RWRRPYNNGSDLAADRAVPGSKPPAGGSTIIQNASVSAPLWCLRGARWSGCAAALVGGVVVLGWLFDVDALKLGFPASAPMMPSTALCFILLGLALALSA